MRRTSYVLTAENTYLKLRLYTKTHKYTFCQDTKKLSVFSYEDMKEVSISLPINEPESLISMLVVIPPDSGPVEKVMIEQFRLNLYMLCRQ